MTGFEVSFCHAGITQIEFCKTSFCVYIWNMSGTGERM